MKGYLALGVLVNQLVMAFLFGSFAWVFLRRSRSRPALDRLRERQGAFAGSLAGIIAGLVLITEGDAVRSLSGVGPAHPMFQALLFTGYLATMLGLLGVNLVLHWSSPLDA